MAAESSCCQIEARAFHIPYTMYVHQFWVLMEADGKIIDQLHGMAVDRFNRCHAVGTPLHRIHVVNLPNSPLAGMNNVSRLICLSDKLKACRERWHRAEAAKYELNALDLRYLVFRQNSNTVFRTLGEIMSIPIPRLGNAPGLDEILSQEIVGRYKYLFLEKA